MAAWENKVAALEHNTTLTNLNLACNRIGAQGAERVAAALEHNTTLTFLNLTSNFIGAQGAERERNF